MTTTQTYKTYDGRLFENKDDAIKHESLIALKDEAITLLGGENKDIDDTCGFSNGDGFYTISASNYDRAWQLASIIKEKLGLNKYHISSRMCSENEYTNSIGYIFSCISPSGGKYKRYGQMYYKLNPSQCGNKEYNND